MKVDIPSDTTLRRQVEKPTAAQADAGNYRKAHIRFRGLDVSIENPRGSIRSGVSGSGKKWSNHMAHHYGYVKRTLGKDGDHVDVFIGPDPVSFMVYVIDQVNPTTKQFDEHKVMLGFHKKEDAKAGYLACYDKGWQGLGHITSVPFSVFKQWLTAGDMTKPFTTWKRPSDVKRAALVDYLPCEKCGSLELWPGPEDKYDEGDRYRGSVECWDCGHSVAGRWHKNAAADDVADGWIGVDLDGTLAKYTDWKGIEHIGAPIPRMVRRIKRWRKDGKDVRIFTARYENGEAAVAVIKKWCKEHLGEELPVTNVKDMKCKHIWDDRGVRVQKNTGKQIDKTAQVSALASNVYNALQRVETGGEKNPWIRTREKSTPGGSTAYGPVQLTAGLAKNYRKNKLTLFDVEERDYLNRFIAQGTNFTHHGNDGVKPKVKDYNPQFDYGGTGSLTNEADKVMYGRVVHKMIQDHLNSNTNDVTGAVAQWRKKSPEEAPGYFRKFRQQFKKDGAALSTYDKQGEMTKIVPFKALGTPDSIKAKFEAELADDHPSRTQGMAKYSSAPGHGMLFDIPGPFWMKGVKYPLDIAFLSKEGRVLDIQHMPVSHAPDYLKARYTSRDRSAAYALEMPAGWFKRAGVAAGDNIMPDVDLYKSAALSPTTLTRMYKGIKAVPQWLGNKQAPLLGEAVAQRASKHGLTTLIHNERPFIDGWNAVDRALGNKIRWASRNWLPREAGKGGKGVLLNLGGFSHGGLVDKRLGEGMKVVGTNPTRVFKNKLHEAQQLPGIIPSAVDVGELMRQHGIRANAPDAGVRLQQVLQKQLGPRFILKPKGGYATPGGSLPTETTDPALLMNILRGRAGDKNVVNYAQAFKGPHTYMAQVREPLQQSSRLERLVDEIYNQRVGGEGTVSSIVKAMKQRGKITPNMSVGGNGTKEWRVHTVDGKVIPYATTGRGSLLGLAPIWTPNKRRAERAATEMLKKMPKKYRNHSYGFDIGKTHDGRFIMIEPNAVEAGTRTIPGGASGLLDAPHLADAAASAVLGKLPAYIRLQRLITALGAAGTVAGTAAGAGTYVHHKRT